jgi:hypothetical protein
VAPKIRHAVVASALAAGALLGGVGVGHAFAATKATPTPGASKSAGSSSGGSSTTHHCPNDSSSSSA